MKILVVGATGTIGKAVASALSARHQVIAASRNSEHCTTGGSRMAGAGENHW